MAETKELVARLRERAEYEDNGGVVEKQLFDTGALLREAADALERLSAPVDGIETTEEERAYLLTHTWPAISDREARLARDFARLQAEVVRLRALLPKTGDTTNV